MISVIIPVKSEGPEVAAAFSRFCRPPEVELVVADGGIGESVREKLRAAGARVLSGNGSRGSRLGRAAAEAAGDILFFLHADSRPPEDALTIIRGAVGRGADAGAFSLAYEASEPAMRWIAWWANRRSRLARLPFGD
jgi:glycosyltransferase involved in cell wall biosynthesis